MVAGAVVPEVAVAAAVVGSNHPSVAGMGLAKKALRRPLSPYMRQRRHADFGGECSGACRCALVTSCQAIGAGIAHVGMSIEASSATCQEWAYDLMN